MESQNGSAMTVLTTVIIVVLIALGVYFGFIRGRETAPANEDNGGLEINVGGGSDTEGRMMEDGTQ